MLKSSTSIFAAVLLFFSSYAACEPVQLVSDGQAQGVIIIASDSPDSVRFAAEELQNHIKQITGALLPIHIESDVAKKNLKVVVSLGATEFARLSHITSEGLSPDGFRIQEAGGVLVIVGRDYKGPPLGDRRGRLTRSYNNKHRINAHGETGTQFGVYRFLMDLGVRWYMPGDIGLVLPINKNVAFNGEAIYDAPHYVYRRLHGFDFNEDAEAALWYKRAGFGSTRYVNLNHSLTDWAERFSGTHPEYFATIDGEPHFNIVKDKKRSIVNFTEPGVLDQVIADADAYFSKNPEEPLFPVVPNDSHVAHDEHVETLEYITKEKYSPGWLSDLVWGFVNKVAIEVNKRHPGKLVGSLAYAYQFDAPSIINRFSPNVVVMHCRQRLFFWDEKYKQHVTDNLQSYTNLRPAKQYIWEYYNLRAREKKLQWLPYVAPRLIASDIRALKDISSGEFIQANQSKGARRLTNPGYYHINLYVTARALWNPDVDIEALLNEYYDLYYGPAAEPMSRFWERLEEIWISQHKSNALTESKSPKRRLLERQRESEYYWTEVYSSDVVKELFMFLDEAASLAKGDAEFSRHVEFIRIQFEPMREMAGHK